MKQRGLTAWGYLILVLVIAGVCWYAYQTIDERAYERGKAEVESTYSKRDNDALRAANAEIQALQEETRKRESEHARQVVEISDKYQKELANGKAKVADLERGIRDGTIRLRDKYASSCPSASGQSAGGETGTSTSGRDAVTGIELSEQTARFLIGEANRADEVVRQLAACQEIVRSDRAEQAGT